METLYQGTPGAKGERPGMPAYNCGRLLAVLEEAQRRASSNNLNATLVDRYYGGASTTPALTLGSLIRLAKTAHLPKLRKSGRGSEGIELTMQEITHQFGGPDKLPTSLGLRDQAAFALGYYHQRAEYRKPKSDKPTTGPSGTSESEPGSTAG